jgi:anaerobic selenocysteine-containing dehydrogenase
VTTPLTSASDHPVRFEDRTRQRVEYSTCYMCACRCGIQVTLQDATAADGSTSTTNVQNV